MSSQQGGPPVGGGVVDLGALRDRGPGAGMQTVDEPLAFYANDVHPGVESEGNVRLTFRYLGPDGASRPLRVTMPTGLLVELLALLPQIISGSIERYAKQATALGKWLGGMQQAAGGGEPGKAPAQPTDLNGRRD